MPLPAAQVTLEQLGWTSEFAAAFDALGDRVLRPARVGIEHNHLYRIFTEQGELMAQAAGRLRHEATEQADLPAVGDWVAAAVTSGEDQATIRSILPRRTCFARQAAGDPTAKQVVAANVDLVFIVTGLDGDFNPRRIGRYLVAAAESGAQPVVVLNKADLCDDLPAQVERVRELAPEVPTHTTCCKTGAGIEMLAAYLTAGRTIALLGSSGAGKSTIINRLLGHARQRTQDVRAADSRGRHTTIHRELIVRPEGGIIIDTPGMRELAVWDTERAVEDAFSEIEALATQCRFRDCEHGREPGCAVQAAVDEATLSADRLEQYHKMVAERAVLEARRAEREELAERKRTRPSGRVLRPKGRLT